MWRTKFRALSREEQKNISGRCAKPPSRPKAIAKSTKTRSTQWKHPKPEYSEGAHGQAEWKLAAQNGPDEYGKSNAHDDGYGQNADSNADNDGYGQNADSNADNDGYGQNADSNAYMQPRPPFKQLKLFQLLELFQLLRPKRRFQRLLRLGRPRLRPRGRGRRRFRHGGWMTGRASNVFSCHCRGVPQ